jgi:hypothetical protein
MLRDDGVDVGCTAVDCRSNYRLLCVSYYYASPFWLVCVLRRFRSVCLMLTSCRLMGRRPCGTLMCASSKLRRWVKGLCVRFGLHWLRVETFNLLQGWASLGCGLNASTHKMCFFKVMQVRHWGQFVSQTVMTLKCQALSVL